MLASLGIGTFLTTNAVPLATVLGAIIIWAVSHLWPAFNDVSQNADGTPSLLGTWVKRGATFLATWLVVLVMGKFGATPPAQMVSEIGVFWAQLLEALAGAAVSGGVFKLATSSPKKG